MEDHLQKPVSKLSGNSGEHVWKQDITPAWGGMEELQRLQQSPHHTVGSIQSLPLRKHELQSFISLHHWSTWLQIQARAGREEVLQMFSQVIRPPANWGNNMYKGSAFRFGDMLTSDIQFYCLRFPESLKEILHRGKDLNISHTSLSTAAEGLTCSSLPCTGI